MELLKIIRKSRDSRSIKELQYFRNLYYKNTEFAHFTDEQLQDILDNLYYVSKSRLFTKMFCGINFKK